MTLNTWSSCPQLLTATITGVHHCTLFMFWWGSRDQTQGFIIYQMDCYSIPRVVFCISYICHFSLCVYSMSLWVLVNKRQALNYKAVKIQRKKTDTQTSWGIAMMENLEMDYSDVPEDLSVVTAMIWYPRQLAWVGMRGKFSSAGWAA